MLQQHLTRRRCIAFTGAAVTASAAGIFLGSQPAEASVTLGDLSIPETDLGAEDGEVYAPHILIHEGAFSFRNLDIEAAKWQVYLLVSDGSDNWSAIGVAEGQITGTEGDGSFSVRGAITAASAWSPEDFSVADDGSPRTVTVPVGVMLVVRDANDDILIDAQATRDVPITINQTGASASTGASGVVAAQDDQTDPTPTMAGGA